MKTRHDTAMQADTNLDSLLQEALSGTSRAGRTHVMIISGTDVISLSLLCISLSPSRLAFEMQRLGMGLRSIKLLAARGIL